MRGSRNELLIKITRNSALKPFQAILTGWYKDESFHRLILYVTKVDIYCYNLQKV